MNIQIVKAHLGQYKAVRDNITDCLRDFISDSEQPLEDRWCMFKEYLELLFQDNINPLEYASNITDEEKEAYIDSIINHYEERTRS